jgi:energy-coupling factor transporter transmembrane protein EcfT
MPGIRIGGPVTLERIQSSLHEALIIATIILLFGAANSVTSPHKLLRILPVSLYQVGVALTIATSALPQFVTSITRIREAQFLRNGKKPRVISIAIPLLEESLSRAVHLAESMESRGFGLSRKRTRYRPILFTARDGALISIAALIATVMVAQ